MLLQKFKSHEQSDDVIHGPAQLSARIFGALYDLMDSQHRYLRNLGSPVPTSELWQ